jgi:pyruvate dehydrogenase E1 component
MTSQNSDIKVNEDYKEWLEALENLNISEGKEFTETLLSNLIEEAKNLGLNINDSVAYPFKNTVSRDLELAYPGDLEKEMQIRHLIRWNSLVTVLKANKTLDLGGHISTYSSASTLYEVGFNHFFKGADNQLGDLIYYQGHSSPGIYARSFLEGRISEEKMSNFRQEIDKPGLSSYPHPWLMPEYWQFPTVSMGLGPIFAIYQAHICKYLENRGLIPKKDDRKIWAFCGDGEMDEPESLGAIGLAGREKLNNLIFVINCNLQRLDGPVRGNSKIITELARQFSGAGWNVVNLIWGRKWDDLIESDKGGLLQQIMDQSVDGEYQNYKSKGGSYTREKFFGKNKDVYERVSKMSDEEIESLNRGGHDPIKVFNAYNQAYVEKERPTVVLAFTIKGYGIGSKQADNATHQVKKLTKENLNEFITYFDLPKDKIDLDDPGFISLDKKSELYDYMISRRKALGGFLPRRTTTKMNLAPQAEVFDEFYSPIEREQSTTMIFVKILTKLLRDKNIGKNVVPIVPDEARTFGMDGLFRQFGIYSSVGQKYEPEDSDQVMFYKESKTGVLLEEGINEAGAFSAWLALATSYANNKLPMIPFYIYYSMFGFQRIHDLAWAAGDSRARGFLLGATSGRTTLNGEGLQHQDGHSHILAGTIPNCKSYDPCFAYEVAAIVKEGIRDMYELNNDNYYYLTLMNENYSHAEMPKGVTEEMIMKGAYLFSSHQDANLRILASGLTLNFAIEAKDILAKYNVNIDIWSITSFNELYRGGIKSERERRLSQTKTMSYVENCFEKEMPTIAVSEYQRNYSNQIREWVNGKFVVLGTDGYGRSDTREKLRDFFEISADHLVINALMLVGKTKDAQNFMKKNKIDTVMEAPWER